MDTINYVDFGAAFPKPQAKNNTVIFVILIVTVIICIVWYLKYKKSTKNGIYKKETLVGL